MTESDMYKTLKRKLDPLGILLQRIEIGAVGVGVPDVFYRTWNRDGWIEFKIAKRYPNNPILRVPFRPGQLGWIHRYVKLHGTVFLFFLVEDDLWIFKNERIKEEYSLIDMGDLCLDVGKWRTIGGRETYNILDRH